MNSVWGILMVLFISSEIVSAQVKNNVCPTFGDYYTIKNNSKCWYNLAAEYEVPEIIKLMGYPVIEYKVQTSDGYILTMYRIPKQYRGDEFTSRHPVYLQHGIVGTSANFVGLGKDSLAFVLADAGYDVWLGNYRGTYYSEEHVNLTVHDQKFWDHGLDEIALRDLPSFFRTILNNSPANSKIIFIGHSLGSTAALMYGTEYPEESNRIIKLFVFLCPAYTLSNMISPFKAGVGMLDFGMETMRRLKTFRIFSQAKELRRVVVPMCTETPETMKYCMQMYNLFYGRETDLGPEIVPVYFNQLPGGTSVRILHHSADLVLGNFRKYNFGKDNFKYYGSHYPPVYDIKKINVPVYMVVSSHDWATTEADAKHLWRSLPAKSRFGFKRIDKKFNHIDFVFGRHAREFVYDPLIKELNRVVLI